MKISRKSLINRKKQMSMILRSQVRLEPALTCRTKEEIMYIYHGEKQLCWVIFVYNGFYGPADMATILQRDQILQIKQFDWVGRYFTPQDEIGASTDKTSKRNYKTLKSLATDPVKQNQNCSKNFELVNHCTYQIGTRLVDLRSWN